MARKAKTTTITTNTAPVVAAPLLQAVVQQEVKATRAPLTNALEGKKTLLASGAGILAGLLGMMDKLPLEQIVTALVGTGPRASITLFAVSTIFGILRGFTKAPIINKPPVVVATEPSKVITQYTGGPGSIQ